MKRLLCLGLAVSLIAFSSVNSYAEAPKTANNKAPQKAMQKEMQLRDTLFKNGLDSLKRLYNKKNIMISPLSIAEASAMLMNGAEGNTKKELEGYLSNGEKLTKELSSYNNTPKKELKVANSMWVGKSIKKEFLEQNKKMNAEAFDEVNAKKINEWVSKKTDKMIKEIVDSSVNGKPSVLVNALAFEAKWLNKYTEDYVKKSFTSIDGKKTQADFMEFYSDKIYLSSDKAEAFVKYYESTTDKASSVEDKSAFGILNNKNFKYLAILPKKGEDFDKYLKALDEKEIETLLKSHEKYKGDKLVAIMPKYKSEYSTGLKEIFQANGVKDAFDKSMANFSKMSDSKGLYVSDIIHKTFVEVDREGTKAAAATAAIMEAMMEQVEPVVHTVTLDRPFIYIILDNDNNPVFMGVQTSI